MEYGVLSIIPPLIAISFAIISKEVVISLFLGLFVGYFIIEKAFFLAFYNSFESIIDLFQESWITKTIIFALLVGSLMKLIEHSGGVQGFIKYVSEQKSIIKSKRDVLFLGYFLGLIIFIESSITSLISGRVMKNFSSKFPISNEKIAYISDSTSAPVCALIPLNSWGALLSSLIASQIAILSLNENSIDMLINSLLFNFYSIITLLFVFFIIYSNKDFFGMKKAEEAIQHNFEKIENQTKSKSSIYMIIPIISLIVCMIVFLYITGNGNILKGSGSTSVFYSVIVSIFVAFLLYIPTKIYTLKEFFSRFYEGIGEMIPVTLILILAFALGELTKELQSGEFLAQILKDSISPFMLPALIFFIGAIISFATGTSWGTFAILMPIAMQSGFELDVNLYLCIGAVISGGVFGDHCSVISDTTIISSLSADCDHMSHVNTQLPYAIICGIFSFVLFLLF
ncbi:MAG: sodium:proton antiporter, partial [Campylobacterales bacterium]|nr:sodium:proton antiporter [Campylobacterales bacterium]